MSEKKQVLYDLRLSYSGPFLTEEFYADIDKWIDERGFEKEPKKKMEHITKEGKKMEYLIEIQSHLDSLHHGLIVLRVLFDNVKESAIKKNGRKIRIDNGDILVHIDGFVQSHIHGSFWQVKPVYYFMRTLVDKYIYNFWSDKWDGKVNSDGKELYKRIRSFFEIEGQKYL
jgi:hypothetical protein